MKKNTMNTYTNSPQNRILSALLAIIMLMSVMLLSVFTADDHSAKGAVSDTTMPPYSNAADGDVAEVADRRADQIQCSAHGCVLL